MGSVSFISLSLFTMISLTAITPTDSQNLASSQLPITLQQIYAEETEKKREKAQQSALVAPPEQSEVTISKFVSQTYNNCGPAALSMVLSAYGTDVSQEELGNQMRPYNSPDGGNDDKSVFPQEFVTYAEKYGYEALYRPNGDMRKLKQFIANDIPVVVRTWLSPEEDISHYRIIKGYNDQENVFIQDDSYQGKDITYTYDEVMDMWKDFNYSFIVVYPEEKKATVEAILGEDMNEQTAWENALKRAENEIKDNPDDAYLKLNQSIAYYYLKEYDKAVSLYDQAKDDLPGRILWYQLEPLQAYQKVGKYERIFEISEAIFYRGNRAYSELYQIRGEIYLKEGKTDLARAEFEKALYYNENYKPAQEALEKI